jgi:hypothetical protein
LSAFLDASFAATTTTTELSESESVCHASAASAIEPVNTLAHILKANKIVFTIIETEPSIYPAFVAFTFASGFYKQQ